MTPRAQDVIDVLAGRWTQGAFRMTDGDADAFCVVGAAGWAWHHDAGWFDVIDLQPDDSPEAAWLVGLAEYLLRTEPRLSEVEGRSPIGIITAWNDVVAETEDEVLDVLAAYEEQR